MIEFRSWSVWRNTLEALRQSKPPCVAAKNACAQTPGSTKTDVKAVREGKIRGGGTMIEEWTLEQEDFPENKQCQTSMLWLDMDLV